MSFTQKEGSFFTKPTSFIVFSLLFLTFAITMYHIKNEENMKNCLSVALPSWMTQPISILMKKNLLFL